MSYTAAKDISRYQGAFTDTGEPIVMIKMSGGDDGLYMDSEASANYQAAVAAGKAVGGYHFGGGVTTAEAEANFFFKAMSPVAENDVFCLDVEAALAARPDVAQWSDDFINYLAGRGVVGGLLYMNLATLNAHDWSAPLAKWGLWLADWAVSPDANVPTNYTYVMQQYSDGPNYDHDAFFGSVDQFKAYGFHAAQPVPAPVTVPTPVTEPAPTPAPTPESAPTPVQSQPTSPPAGDFANNPASNQVPLPVSNKNSNFAPSTVAVTASNPSIWQMLVRWLVWFFK